MVSHVVDGDEPHHVRERADRSSRRPDAALEAFLWVGRDCGDRLRPVAHELGDQVRGGDVDAPLHLLPGVVVDRDGGVPRLSGFLVGGRRQLQEALVRPLHRREVGEQLVPVPPALVDARREVEAVETRHDVVARRFEGRQQLRLRPHRVEP